MIREERFERMRTELSAYGVLDSNEFADRVGVSRATIRRDLDILEERGLLKRTHGGAVPIDPKEEQPFTSKIQLSSPEKREIGRLTAQLLPDGAVIGCTGGTTIMNVMKSLRSKHLTVITNAINVAVELASHDEVQIVVTGGTLRPRTYELVGPEADETLKRFHLDIAVLGVDGISCERGISTYVLTEAHTAAMYIAQAKQVWVVADHTKIGKTAPALIAPIHQIHRLITDAGMDPVQKAEFEAAGVEIVIAEID